MTTQTTAHPSDAVNQLLQGPVDFDLLQTAYKAFPRCAIARYHWMKSPHSPFKPIGYIPYEWVLQLATFLIPVCVLLLAWAQWSEAYFWGVPTFLLWSLPVALRIGWVLDNRYSRWLSLAITRARAEDGGRYQAVDLISKRASVNPEKLTLRVIEAMAHRYVEESKRRAQVKRQAARATSTAATTRGAATSGAVIAGVAAAAASASYASDVVRRAQDDGLDMTTVTPLDTGIDMDDDLWSSSSFDPIVNVNGTPMVPGSGVDIYGSPYGVDNF